MSAVLDLSAARGALARASATSSLPERDLAKAAEVLERLHEEACAAHWAPIDEAARKESRAFWEAAVAEATSEARS